MKASARFRELFERDEIAIAAGAHDPLTARIVEEVGFADLVYMTGWGSSVALTGMPDAGMWTMTEMTEMMGNVTDVVDLPVFADDDDGHGDAPNVTRTVRKCIKAGLVAIHIEDEAPPKPLVPGPRVLPREAAVGKIRAVTETRDRVDEDFVVIARSMTHYPEQFSDTEIDIDDPVGESIRRVREYFDAGADMVNLTLDTRGKYERVCRELDDLPLLVTGNFVQLEPRDFEV